MKLLNSEKLPGLAIISGSLAIFWFCFGVLFWLSAKKMIPPHPNVQREMIFFIVGTATTVTLSIGYWAIMRGAKFSPLAVIVRLSCVLASTAATIIFYQAMMNHPASIEFGLTDANLFGCLLIYIFLADMLARRINLCFQKIELSMLRNDIASLCRLESSQILIIGILICVGEGLINLYELIIAALIFCLFMPSYFTKVQETNEATTGP